MYSRQYIKRFRTEYDKVIITFSEGNVSSLIEVVVGGGVDLPCDTSPPRYLTLVQCTLLAMNKNCTLIPYRTFTKHDAVLPRPPPPCSRREGR